MQHAAAGAQVARDLLAQRVEQRAAVAAGVPRAPRAAAGQLAVAGRGRYGGLETIVSKRSPARPLNSEPRRVRTRTPFRRALTRALSSARRKTSTAVVRAPSSAAWTASRPLPVQRSRRRPPGGGGCSRSAAASIQLSLCG